MNNANTGYSYGINWLYTEEVHPADKQQFSRINHKRPNQVRCNKPRLVRRMGMR